MDLVFFGFTWFSSAILGSIVGSRYNAWLGGAVLGLFFGPLGVLAAFALDNRGICPRCYGRIDDRAYLCMYCHTPLRKREEEDRPTPPVRPRVATLRPEAVPPQDFPGNGLR